MVLMSYKNIGDSLTTDEFNAIVSLLKHNKTLVDELEIKNGAVNGEYGTYTFDLESTTVVDNGILITDETLTSLGAVKLTNPVFSNATYKLHLTVISMEEPNILDDNKSETTTTDLEITLEKNVAVPIPFETLTNYCIILFNASIEIKQDQPTIIGKYVTGLTITGDKTVIQTNDTVNLTIKATDLDNIGVPNKNIKLYKNNTLWQTLTTDTNGEINVSYTGEGTGVLNIQAVHGGIIQSETYSILDCIYFDPCTSDTTSRFYVDTSRDNSIAFSTDKLVLTLGTGNQFTRLDTDTSALTLSDYVGKSVRFKVDVTPSRMGRVQISQYVSGVYSGAVSSDWVTTASTIYVDADIDANVTRLFFIIGGNGTGATSGDTIDIQNIRIYPV